MQLLEITNCTVLTELVLFLGLCQFGLELVNFQLVGLHHCHCVV